MNRVLKIGLTGGIASGKTAVGEMFATLGAYVIDADKIAHQLLQPGENVYQEVVNAFGNGILNPDQTVNRSRLAALAFGAGPSRSRIDELNRIIHPTVIQKQNEWMDEIGRGDPNAIAMVEAALLLEAGVGKSFDRIMVVTCRPEQRIERWARRRGIDLKTASEEVSRRMAGQFSDEVKIKAADYLIDNSESLDETRKEVDEVYAKLKP